MRRSGRVLLLTLLLTGGAGELQSSMDCAAPPVDLVTDTDPDGNPALALLAPPEGPRPPYAAPRTLRDRARAARLDAELRDLAGHLMIPVKGVAAGDLRDSYNDKRGSRHHHAMDIMAPEETPVLSVTAGRVLQISENGVGGRMIITSDSSGRFMFLYAHLDEYADGLAAGMPLRRGQLIGYVGTTGNAPSSAPHLHFAIKRAQGERLTWSRGTPVDPHPLLMPPDVAKR